MALFVLQPSHIYPIVRGGPDSRACLPLGYRLTRTDEIFDIATRNMWEDEWTEDWAHRVLRDAADVWNDEFGCTVLEERANGPLEIRFVEGSTYSLQVGVYDPLLRRIDLNIWYHSHADLVHTAAHEMGHAMLLGHSDRGLMQSLHPDVVSGMPTLSDDDRRLLHRRFLFL